MRGQDDALRCQVREAALAEDVRRNLVAPFLGAPSLLARTATLRTYPTAAQSYYACQSLTLLGTEIEGGGGTITSATSAFFALNLGSTVPPSGTQIVTTFVGNRWVFRYDG